MSRSIEEIKNDLAIINLRLNMLIEESRNIDERGKTMSKRRNLLIEELEEAENA